MQLVYQSECVQHRIHKLQILYRTYIAIGQTGSAVSCKLVEVVNLT